MVGILWILGGILGRSLFFSFLFFFGGPRRFRLVDGHTAPNSTVYLLFDWLVPYMQVLFFLIVEFTDEVRRAF